MFEAPLSLSWRGVCGRRLPKHGPESIATLEARRNLAFALMTAASERIKGTAGTFAEAETLLGDQQAVIRKQQDEAAAEERAEPRASTTTPAGSGRGGGAGGAVKEDGAANHAEEERRKKALAEKVRAAAEEQSEAARTARALAVVLESQYPPPTTRRKALAEKVKALAEEESQTARALAVVLESQCRGVAEGSALAKEREAERLLNKSREGFNKLHGARHRETLSTTVQLAGMLLEGDSRDVPRARELLQQAVPRLQALVGPKRDLQKAEDLLKRCKSLST